MKITIDIPDKFINDYATDKFKDFFSRVAADIDNDGLCGNYEKETAEMFLKAFEESGREINADKEPKMERLTIKTEDGYERQSIRTKNQQLIDKLAYYEDLEEQGRLVKLPCNVGDTVYVKMASYCKTHYAEAEVRDFVHFISCGFCAVVTSKYFDKQNIPFSEFGKTVFLTKSEAEAKLKELRGGEDEV